MNKAKQYFDDLFKNAAALKEKFNEIEKHAETDPQSNFIKNQAKLLANSAEAKYLDFYNLLIKRIPEDKKPEVNEYLKKLYFRNENIKKHFKINYAKELETVKYEYELFPLIALAGDKSEIVENIASYLSEKDIEESINENKQFISKEERKEKVKLLDSEITEAKQFVEENETDAEKKKEILKELDLINETVIGANKEYKDRIDNCDKDFSSGRIMLNGQSLDSYLEKHNPESFKFLKRQHQDTCLVNEEEIKKNPEEFKKHATNVKLNLSEQHKQSTLKVLKAIEKMGIYNPNDNGNEQGTKVYGFRQIFDAQVAIRHALQQHDYSRLKELRENYTKAIENMKELFALTKKEFNPSPETMVGNLSNLRQDYVPYDFVDDIATNSTVSSLYNMYTIIKSIGCTPEEFVNDPAKYLSEYRENLKNHGLNIDERTNGKSIAEALSHPMLYSFMPNPDDLYPSYALPRIIEGLTNREKDPTIKEELHYNGVYFNGVDSLYVSYTTGYRQENSYMANHYLRTNGPQTIANVLLVNDEDRIYSKLRAHEHYDPKDDVTIIKPFDVKGYLTTHRIDPIEFKNRVINTTSELYTLFQEKHKFFTEQKALGKIDSSLDAMPELFNEYLSGAQIAIQEYLLLNNPSLSHMGIADEPGIADLVEMLKDPTKMFKDIELNEETLEFIDTIKNADKLVDETKTEPAKEFKKFVAEERKLESAFNKQAKKLFKNWQYSTDNKYNDLKRKEVDRLEKLFKDNKIPKDYYEQRINLIGSEEFDTKVPIFDDGIMSKKDYIKSTGLEALTKEEMNGLYESYKLKLEHEKQIFLHSNYMVKKELIPAPDKVSTEPLHSPEEIKKEQPKIEKISIKIEDEKDLQPETLISNVSKEKTVEKDNEINKN